MNDSLCDLCSLALSTRLIIFDTVLSPKLFVVCTRSTPVRFTQPDTTSSSFATSHGTDSPVSATVLSDDSPSTTRPSSATFSPGFITIVSPTCTSDGETTTYIHKVGYAVATLALGIAFKQFAYLEE